MAFCKECGSTIPDGAGFCNNCGTPTSGKPVKKSPEARHLKTFDSSSGSPETVWSRLLNSKHLDKLIFLGIAAVLGVFLWNLAASIDFDKWLGEENISYGGDEIINKNNKNNKDSGGDVNETLNKTADNSTVTVTSTTTTSTTLHPCRNRVLDEGEVDVDCGGDCPPCPRMKITGIDECEMTGRIGYVNVIHLTLDFKPQDMLWSESQLNNDSLEAFRIFCNRKELAGIKDIEYPAGNRIAGDYNLTVRCGGNALYSELRDCDFLQVTFNYLGREPTNATYGEPIPKGGECDSIMDCPEKVDKRCTNRNSEYMITTKPFKCENGYCIYRVKSTEPEDCGINKICVEGKGCIYDASKFN